VRRAQINQQHLVVAIVNGGGEVGAKQRELPWIELAEEDGELSMIAASFEKIEDLTAPLIISDVVRDEEVPAGGHRVVTPV